MCLMKCSLIIVVNKCGILSQSSIIIVLIIKFLFSLGIIFVFNNVDIKGIVFCHCIYYRWTYKN